MDAYHTSAGVSGTPLIHRFTIIHSIICTPETNRKKLGLIKGSARQTRVASTDVSSSAAANQPTQQDRLERQTVKYEEEMIQVYTTLGLTPGARITLDHVNQLTTTEQMDAVAWCKFNHHVLKGSLSERHDLLKQLFEQNMCSV